MDTSYWNLFWSTGMPEAWLMSRNVEGPRPAGPEVRRWPGGRRELPDPAAGFYSHMPDSSPGGPGGFY